MPMEILVLLTNQWVTIEKPLSIVKDMGELEQKMAIGQEEEEPMEISVM